MGKIVWLAAYPKSGNTWLRAFLHNYILRAETPHAINRLADFTAVESAREFFPPAITTELAVQRARAAAHARLTRLHEDLVFVKTHNAHLAVAGIPLCTPAHTAGALHILRDPRDVAVSYANYLNKPVDEIIALMQNPRAANRTTSTQVFEYLASWSIHAESWAAAPNTLTVRFEDLLTSPQQYFGRVVEFLGGAPEPARLHRAIAFSNFAELSRQEQADGYAAAGETAPVFFRAGSSGQWRAALAAAQIRRIETAHQKTMQKFGYLA